MMHVCTRIGWKGNRLKSSYDVVILFDGHALIWDGNHHDHQYMYMRGWTERIIGWKVHMMTSYYTMVIRGGNYRVCICNFVYAFIFSKILWVFISWSSDRMIGSTLFFVVAFFRIDLNPPSRKPCDKISVFEKCTNVWIRGIPFYTGCLNKAKESNLFYYWSIVKCMSTKWYTNSSSRSWIQLVDSARALVLKAFDRNRVLSESNFVPNED